MAGARLEVGDRVQVFDLQLTPQYNGHLGKITKIIQDQQIATVRLDKPLSSFTKIELRCSNLKLVSEVEAEAAEAAEAEAAEAAETEAADTEAAKAAEEADAEAAEAEPEAAEEADAEAAEPETEAAEAERGADEEAEAVVVDAVVVAEAEEERATTGASPSYSLVTFDPKASTRRMMEGLLTLQIPKNQGQIKHDDIMAAYKCISGIAPDRHISTPRIKHLKSAFLKCKVKMHPDKWPDHRALATEAFQLVSLVSDKIADK